MTDYAKKKRRPGGRRRFLGGGLFFLVREPGEVNQIVDRGRFGHRDALGLLAAHHDLQAVALRVVAATAQVGPAAADALAVQVAQHGSAAHALLVADDLAALADPRDEEGDLRQLFAGPAVTHHVFVADDVALGVLQVFVRHRLGLDDRAAAGREAEGKNDRCSFDRFHISTFLVFSGPPTRPAVPRLYARLV